MNATSLTVLKNVTTIVNKTATNTVISTSKVTSIANTAIKVTTIGIKGDTQDLGIINRINNTKGFKDLVIVDNELLSSHIYTDATKTTKLYDITFTWIDGLMIKKVIMKNGIGSGGVV